MGILDFDEARKVVTLPYGYTAITRGSQAMIAVDLATRTVILPLGWTAEEPKTIAISLR